MNPRLAICSVTTVEFTGCPVSGYRAGKVDGCGCGSWADVEAERGRVIY